MLLSILINIKFSKLHFTKVFNGIDLHFFFFIFFASCKTSMSIFMKIPCAVALRIFESNGARPPLTDPP